MSYSGGDQRKAIMNRVNASRNMYGVLALTNNDVVEYVPEEEETHSNLPQAQRQRQRQSEDESTEPTGSIFRPLLVEATLGRGPRMADLDPRDLRPHPVSYRGVSQLGANTQAIYRDLDGNQDQYLIGNTIYSAYHDNVLCLCPAAKGEPRHLVNDCPNRLARSNLIALCPHKALKVYWQIDDPANEDDTWSLEIVDTWDADALVGDVHENCPRITPDHRIRLLAHVLARHYAKFGDEEDFDITVAIIQINKLLTEWHQVNPAARDAERRESLQEELMLQEELKRKAEEAKSEDQKELEEKRKALALYGEKLKRKFLPGRTIAIEDGREVLVKQDSAVARLHRNFLGKGGDNTQGNNENNDEEEERESQRHRSESPMVGMEYYSDEGLTLEELGPLTPEGLQVNSPIPTSFKPIELGAVQGTEPVAIHSSSWSPQSPSFKSTKRRFDDYDESERLQTKRARVEVTMVDTHRSVEVHAFEQVQTLRVPPSSPSKHARSREISNTSNTRADSLFSDRQASPPYQSRHDTTRLPPNKHQRSSSPSSSPTPSSKKTKTVHFSQDVHVTTVTTHHPRLKSPPAPQLAEDEVDYDDGDIAE